MITNLRARLLGAFALVLLLVVVEIAIAYQQDVNSYPPQLAALGALTSDNPPQVARWKNIAAAAEQLRTNVTEPGIALRRQVSAGSASPGALAGFDHSGAAEQASAASIAPSTRR